MTREGLIAKIEKYREDDYEHLHNLTRRVIDNFLGVLSEPYYCPEKTGLHIYLTEVSYVLEIMRPDLLDHDVLSRIKFLIEKRLKAIENEQS
jgi:hypothetical protein